MPHHSHARALTPVSYTHLNENLANNIGANQTLVFSGLPPAESEIGSTGAFTFFLSSNFDYNPSAGNLLLTVITNAPGSSGSMTTYLAVSYTHLDVYKRQVCARSATGTESC